MQRHHTALAVLAGLLPMALAAQDPLVMRIQSVAADAYVISGFSNGNILALVGEAGVLLVDAQTERRVAMADSVLRTVTPLPVRVVINTHYHEDHISGNRHWRSRGAEIIGHVALAAEATKDTTIPELEWHRTPAAIDVLPDRTFLDSLRLFTDDEPVIVLHPLGAHTSGDAIVWFPRKNLIHTGDILEREAPPFIDWWAGGSLDGMIAGVDVIAMRANDQTLLVPGHGTPTDRAGLLAYRAMLVAARDRIGGRVSAGENPDAIADARPLREFETMLGGQRRAREFVRQTARGLGGSAAGR